MYDPELRFGESELAYDLRGESPGERGEYEEWEKRDRDDPERQDRGENSLDDAAESR